MVEMEREISSDSREDIVADMHSRSDSKEEGSKVVKIPASEWFLSSCNPLFKSKNYLLVAFNSKLLAH